MAKAKKAEQKAPAAEQDAPVNENQLEEQLKADLVVFDPIEANIKTLVAEYKKLQVLHAFDKDGMAAVKAARLNLVAIRNNGDRIRKGLVSSALAYQKGVNEYWKKNEAILIPAEADLKKIETYWQDERDRLEREKYDGRVKRLIQVGMMQDSSCWFFETYKITFEDLKLIEDAAFEEFHQAVSERYEQAQLAKKAEEERLEQLRIANEKQAAELEELRKQLEEQKLKNTPPKPDPEPEQPSERKVGNVTIKTTPAPSGNEFYSTTVKSPEPAGSAQPKPPINIPPVAAAAREYFLRRAQEITEPQKWIICSRIKADQSDLIQLGSAVKSEADGVIYFIPTSDQHLTIEELKKIVGALEFYSDKI